MNNAKLYSDFCNFQKKDSSEVFAYFLDEFKNEAFQFESLLDFGCGPGDTLVQQILPQLSESLTRVVGVDISKQMIDFAIEKYESESTKFYVFDIQNDCAETCGFLDLGSFDLVTSFYCYCWLRNEKLALSNVYNLLKIGGSFVMIFPIRHPYYDECFQLSSTEQYSQFMSAERMEKFVTPYFHQKKPVEALSGQFKNIGFKIDHIELRDMNFTFLNQSHLENSFKAVNPFNMPEEVQSRFTRDCASIIASSCTNFVNEESELNVRYKLMISFVVK